MTTRSLPPPSPWPAATRGRPPPTRARTGGGRRRRHGRDRRDRRDRRGRRRGRDRRRPHRVPFVSSDYGLAGAAEIDVEVAHGPRPGRRLPARRRLARDRAGRPAPAGRGRRHPAADAGDGAGDRVGEGGPRIALHPDFATNRALFLYYTSDEGGLHNRVEQWILSEDGASAVADRVIVGDIPAGLYHNGGRLRIGPDDHLWVTTGDARVPSSSQDPTSLAGAILRVDTDGNVPADNPDPNSPIVVSGVRNSQGIDWLPDGRLIIIDHGPSGDTGRRHDEPNVAEVGANPGQSVLTAARRRRASPALHDPHEALRPAGTPATPAPRSSSGPATCSSASWASTEPAPPAPHLPR